MDRVANIAPRVPEMDQGKPGGPRPPLLATLPTDRAHLGPACLLIALFLACGVVAAPPEGVLAAWGKLLRAPCLVGTDFLALAGPVALVNAGVLGLIGLAIIHLIRVDRPGYEIAGLFLWIGCGLMGKHVLNIWPTIAGVMLFRRVSGRSWPELFPPLFFGTTLAPIFSQYAFGAGLGPAGVALGLGLGVLAGFLLAALMDHVYTFHLGQNLYNIGTAGGFVGIVVAMTMRGFGLENHPAPTWSTAWSVPLTRLLGPYFLGLIAWGLAVGADRAGYRRMLRCCGRLPTEFIRIGGWGNTLVNMGLMGLIGLVYVCGVGGAVNGPTVAGMLALSGFGALGKHPRNCLPIMAGVWAVAWPKIWAPADPGPLLAALFCTTLAPFCGRFGLLAGFVAGALHLPMVMHVGQIHGFLNLYNNGFAGGLTMMIVVGVVKGICPGVLGESNESARPAASPAASAPLPEGGGTGAPAGR